MGEVVCNDTAYLGNGGEERGYGAGQVRWEDVRWRLAECKFKHSYTHLSEMKNLIVTHLILYINLPHLHPRQFLCWGP